MAVDPMVRKLEKEVARLKDALAEAQALNTGLEKDKDWAFMLLQIFVSRQHGRTYVFTPDALEKYDPKRWTLHQQRDLHSGGLQLQITENKKNG